MSAGKQERRARVAIKKSTIPYSEAKALIDKICAELGYHQEPKSNFLKIESPVTKHRTYVQMSKNLSRIDTTLEIKGEEGTYPLEKHNGSIKCHLDPTLENLERRLRMMADIETVGTQVVNRPRPMQIVRGPAPRVPRPTVAAQPSALQQQYNEKLKRLKERQALAKRRRFLEEQGLSDDEVDRIVHAGGDPGDVRESQKNAFEMELGDELFEAGIDVEDV